VFDFMCSRVVLCAW